MTNPIELTAPERRPRGVAVLWVSILALFATAVFGALTVTEDETTTASSEPEAAVRKMLSAIADTDVLGVLDALLPSERDLLREPIVDLASEAKRLGLLSEDLSLDDISGVEVSFDGVTFATNGLADDIASVRLTGGTITTSSVGRELPLGELFDGVDRPTGEDRETEPIAKPGGDPVEFVTVREGGKWYVSFAYTLAEAARRESGASLPQFGKGVTAQGHPTPHAAAEALLRAALELDPERLIALAPPGEGRALRDYAPLFLTDLKRQAAEARNSFSAQLRDLKTDVKVSGDRAQVVLKALTVTFLVDGNQGEVVLEGTCATVKLAGQAPLRNCAEDAPEDILRIFDQGRLPETGFAVVNENGAWYVSPTRTFTDLLLAFARALNPEGLQELVRQFTGTREA